MLIRHAPLIALPLLAAACSGSSPVPSGPAGKITIETSAVTYGALTDACYRLVITNPDGDVVIDKPNVCADRFGDGAGDISYVAPCDASFDTNTVSLVIESLVDESGPIATTDYVNPCGDPTVDPTSPDYNYDGFGPCTRVVACEPNADTRVGYDLTVMRDARQGFFDIAVTFDDIFCSAKADCTDPVTGEPNTLLFAPGSSERIPTTVLALACTAGPGSSTVLHFGALTLTCDGQAPITIDLAGPDGNQYSTTSAAPAPLQQVAIYRDVEDLVDQFTGLSAGKIFQNVALGFDLSGVGKNCRVALTATAAEGMLDECTVELGTTYPVVTYDLGLTNAAGTGFACTQHPVDGTPGENVFTTYTTGTTFTTTVSASGTSAVAANCDGTGGPQTGSIEGVVYYERRQQFMGGGLEAGRAFFVGGQSERCFDYNTGEADVNCWELFGYHPPADRAWHIVHGPDGLDLAGDPVIQITGSGGYSATTVLTGTDADYRFDDLPSDQTYCVTWVNAGFVPFNYSRWPSEPQTPLFETPTISPGAGDWAGRQLEQCGIVPGAGTPARQDFGMVYGDGAFIVLAVGEVELFFYYEGNYAGHAEAGGWSSEWLAWGEPGYQEGGDTGTTYSCQEDGIRTQSPASCDQLFGPDALNGSFPIGVTLFVVDVYDEDSGDYLDTLELDVDPAGASYTASLPDGSYCFEWFNPPGHDDSTSFPDGGGEWWNPSIRGASWWPSEPYIESPDTSGPWTSWDGSPIMQCGIIVAAGEPAAYVGFGFVAGD